ncbi:hypothetical protein HDU97_009950 [Phlyctochytrium planicorne]|nr:hypothetical protein HDU97_009950 [Phlyctochytrium planicorne]
MSISVNIKCSTEAKFSVSLNADATVLELKEAIAKEMESSANPTPPSSQRLIFAGRVLKDEETLPTYKVVDGSTVHLVRSKPPGAATTPSTTTPAASTTTPAAAAPSPATTTPTTNPANPTSPSAAANPFAALFGAGGPGGAGNFGASPFSGMGAPGAGLGAGGLNNMDPNLMNNLMSNPAVAASMSQLFSNPAIMDAMIASNPQLAQMMTPQMRAMMQSEGFRRMMADPNFVRTMMQMAPLMGGGANPFGQGFGAPGGAPGFGADAGAEAGANNPMNPTGAGAFDPALLSMLMGGMPPPARPAPPANPEEAYREQLRQLQDMGFYDAAENIRALNHAGGNVNGAVEYLFNNPPR